MSSAAKSRKVASGSKKAGGAAAEDSGSGAGAGAGAPRSGAGAGASFDALDEMAFADHIRSEEGRHRIVPGEDAARLREAVQGIADRSGLPAKLGEALKKYADSFLRDSPVLAPSSVVGSGAVTRVSRDLQRSPFEPVLYTADHDARLLQTPHYIMTDTGRVVMTPSCRYQENCLARKGVFGYRIANSPPDGFTLMADMTPAELAAFHRDGTIPDHQRPCLLCTRASVLTSYYHHVLSGTNMPNICIQTHYSLVNQDGGYDSKYCIMPTERGTYGLVAPLAYFDMSGMRAVRRQAPVEVPGQGREAGFYYQVEVLYRWKGARYMPAAGEELPENVVGMVRSF